MPKTSAIPIRSRQLISLAYARETLVNEGVFLPEPPSRHYFYSLLESGILEGKLCAGAWYIYMDSFLKLVETLQTPDIPQ